MTVASGKLIKGATGDWEMVIGLEVHAQVTSNSKLFSGASTAFGGDPNSHVSLVDAAMPGMLPVINEECVRQAVRTGLGLNAQINLRSVFDRKNYFYPDLPQGYQISQYKSPIVGEGEVVVELSGGDSVAVGIERLHLEQDAGKLLHDQNPTMSLVDLNRCGVALMEIVSKPDIRSSEQAKAYVAKLRSILRYLGTCDGDMEKGSLRADVNVSVRRAGATELGTRCEIKNMNSISFIGDAIEYEARRQIEIIEDGGAIDQETRLYDPNKGETRSMRSKEEAHDYRYFPDPDLLPLEFSQVFVDDLKAVLPELPDPKKARLVDDWGLSALQAERLTRERDLAESFEEEVYRYILQAHGQGASDLIRAAYGWESSKIREHSCEEFSARRRAAEPYHHSMMEGAESLANLILGPVMEKCNEVQANPADHLVRLNLPEFVRLILDGTISGKIAKGLFEIVWQEGGDPREIVEARGMKQVTDLGAIETVVDQVVAANAAKVDDARTNPNTIGWFVGQVMKSSKGKANPQKTTEILRTKLFDSWIRTRPGPLKPGERLYDYFDQSARTGYEELRSILNLWVSEVEDANYRNELISRITKGGNAGFRGALSELIVYDLLVRLGQKIVVHAVVPGTSRKPDFAIVEGKGRTSAYVEVTTVNRPDRLENDANRESDIFNAINELKLPEGSLLGYKLVRAGANSPALGPTLDSIETWAQSNADRAKTEEVVERFVVDDWVIELELFSATGVSDATGSVGIIWQGGGNISPHEDIRAALYRKSRGYGEMNAPYIIAVADAKGQTFGKQQVRDAVTEAVFGDERAVFVGGDTAKLDFAPNGFWRGPDGPRNKHVTAILFLPQIDVWKLRDPKWEPILALNPWATSQLPNSFKSLNRLEADDGKWVERPGKPIGDLLGLPEPWPPDE